MRMHAETRPITPDPPRAPRWPLLLLGICSVALALLAAEVALRVAGPREQNYYVLLPNMRQSFEPGPEYFRGLSARTSYSTSSLGLRGDELPADTTAFRLLVVGGSTTENIYLDDRRTWTELLESRLTDSLGGREAWVGAAGRSGMNSRDHVMHVDRLLAQLPRIDRLLVLVGVNDLSVMLAQGDSFGAPPALNDPEAVAAAEARAFSVVPGAMHESRTIQRDAPWHKRTALWQLGARIRANVHLRRSQTPLRQDTRGVAVERWRRNRQHASAWRDRPPELDSALATYARNLERIADAAARHGVELSFLTQPSIWSDDLDSAAVASLWLGGIGDFQREEVGTYFTHRALRASMAAFNAQLLAVCDARRLRCLDLASRVPRDTSMFVDDVHFTERGAARVAESVGDWLVAERKKSAN